MLKNVSPTNAKSYHEYLLANSRTFITLESRIADLLIANWKIHFDTGEIKHMDFPAVIAHTRHYYTHYDERIKEYKDEKNIPFYTVEQALNLPGVEAAIIETNEKYYQPGLRRNC